MTRTEAATRVRAVLSAAHAVRHQGGIAPLWVDNISDLQALALAADALEGTGAQERLERVAVQLATGLLASLGETASGRSEAIHAAVRSARVLLEVLDAPPERPPESAK